MSVLAHRGRRRGLAVVLTAFGAIALLGFVTLAVDVGFLAMVAGQTQRTADGSALAGVSALRDSDYDYYDERAIDIINMNEQTDGYASMSTQKIEVGRWHRFAKTFTVMAASDASHANAVRVVNDRNGLPLFIASVVGVDQANISRSSIAAITPTCGGIWGLIDVRVPGNVVTDSYDSRNGQYVAANAGQKGDVCSNGDLLVAGSVIINGDALGTPVTTQGGAYTITGNVDILDEPLVAPDVDFGDVAVNNDNATIGLTDLGNDPFAPGGGWHLEMSGQDSITLAPGTYYFDSLTLEGMSSMTFTGETTLYVAGDIKVVGGAVVGGGGGPGGGGPGGGGPGGGGGGGGGPGGPAGFVTTGDPRDLNIIALSTTIQIAGTSAFYGSILAPDSQVQLSGTSDFYGALIGGVVALNGDFQFHVDESLEITRKMRGQPRIVQ